MPLGRKQLGYVGGPAEVLAAVHIAEAEIGRERGTEFITIKENDLPAMVEEVVP